jgi:2-polyprenyl-6-methoxyphenol hydroxylase-like FAD-dependent oxidoreductase
MPGTSFLSHAPQRRAVVIGGSMSGLLAGLMLHRAGWQVDIFERVEGELAGRGAGIVAQPELIKLLHGLGIEARDFGVDVEKRRFLDSAGRIVLERECRQVMTAWERVFRLLRDAFPLAHYHRGVGLRAFEQSSRSVMAHLSDRRSIEAAVLIGADGLRSTVRQLCLPELAPQYAGYVAWRGLIAEGDLSAATHRDLFAYMSFCLPPGEQMLGYPVAGPDNDLRVGHRRFNMVWYRPADERTELVRLLTDAQGATHALSIPPPLIRPEVIAAMRAAGERLLAPQFVEIVRLSAAAPMLQPIYDLATPRMAFGRVAILGDAAFVARPHVGAGVAKAADDAAALAEALQSTDDVEAALLRFEAQRLVIGHRIIARARHLGSYLQANRTEEEKSHSARHSIPEAVLAETALLDFLETG